MDYAQLTLKIKAQAKSLGFLQANVAHVKLPAHHAEALQKWLDEGKHGSMSFFEKHGTMRTNASYVLPEAQSIILCAMPYWTDTIDAAKQELNDPDQAYISRYALGRDYHKVLRQRLKKLSELITQEVPEALCRPVVDSAPVSEVSFATMSGLGWRGKHTLLLQKSSGSLFFLGALITSLPLITDKPQVEHCGNCNRCIQACPTNAIIAPYEVDARRCLSYLTIESPDIVPLEFRKAMGNRIYGCDDCQIVCPFNRFSHANTEVDFNPRNNLNHISLLALLSWSEADFQSRMAGSPIYRIGFTKWLSNIIIALGNANKSTEILHALHPYTQHPDGLISEAAMWSIQQHQN